MERVASRKWEGGHKLRRAGRGRWGSGAPRALLPARRTWSEASARFLSPSSSPCKHLGAGPAAHRHSAPLSHAAAAAPRVVRPRAAPSPRRGPRGREERRHPGAWGAGNPLPGSFPSPPQEVQLPASSPAALTFGCNGRAGAVIGGAVVDFVGRFSPSMLCQVLQALLVAPLDLWQSWVAAG